MADVLEIRNLSVRYPDGTRALHGVDLTVAAGQRLGLIGPNGAGKTSQLLAVMRGVPFEGSILVDGVALSRRQAARARSQCGMTFQNADDQLFMATLLDDVAFGPLNQGSPADQAAAAATAAIAAVGLSGLEHRPAHHLSGGQMRAASLATVLSMNIKLLLLDEPASNLDFRSRQRLLEILTARPEAVVLATHDLELVAQLCSRVVVLDDGRVAADGPAASILSDRALLAVHGLA
ncbi:MAG: energy-coupling factor ABC transporter ATP-binding protein [Phycisphaerae bacterium]|nr:energy-coupling factor ABC transporter ATP-binding protein [Phycisphaerae bacterium]